MVSCRSLLSLFGCGFCCYSFFLGRGWFFSLSISSGIFPLLTPRAGFRHQIPRIFLFPPCTVVGSQEGIFFFFGCWVFGFVISLVTEMKRGHGRGQECVSRGGWGKANKNPLCLCPFLGRKVNQKSRGERWSQSPAKIRSFAPSLSSRLLWNNCYFFLNTRFL